MENVQLLERFAAVFDLTYTRFLDLKNAEAQAREAKIETALEKVRSRTMAMQKVMNWPILSGYYLNSLKIWASNPNVRLSVSSMRWSM